MFAEEYAVRYDAINKNKPYKKEIEFVYNWAKRPKSICDIGCGTASYWKYFPKHVRLFGIEKSEHMVTESKHKFSIYTKDITKALIPGWFHMACALFHVINYIPRHDWWRNIPVRHGGYFIFDIWDKKKVDANGFKTTIRREKHFTRMIDPICRDKNRVTLRVSLYDAEGPIASELHKMYIYSDQDIERFCGPDFKIVETKNTNTWTKWYKCKKR